MSAPQSLPSPPSHEQGSTTEGTKVPLPATPQQPSPLSAPPGKTQGWDRTLTLLLLLLAFLSASFLARNSDLWFHLGTGRLIAEGRFPFGQDPFAYTTQGVYWANHSWLFDLALYEARTVIGDAGLAVLKSLLVSVLAGVMLCLRRREQSMLVPVFCLTLALLAMSPRLLLQPACASYLFLGLTLWLLWRPHALAQPADASRSARIVLLLLFALWVNVDEWFLLGPLLTVLFFVGERLRGQRQTPAWLVAAGIAVCLLSPFTYHGFTLPTEFSSVAWTSGLREDARFRALFVSPWQAAYWRAASEGNAAFLAYYVLNALGIASFVLNRSAVRSWRLVVWLPFAALAAWQARLTPFFAIVAAPITALNIQDVVVERYSTDGNRALTVAARMAPSLLVLALLALIGLDWMGWLAGRSGSERHVAWGVQADPSLQRAAQTLQAWRQQGRLSQSDHVFAFHPEVAQYSAFFAPEEKHFFDHRYALFAETVSDYETVCRAFLETGKQRPPDKAWRRVLSDHKAAIVVVYDPSLDRTFALLHRLGGDRKNWTLLEVCGSVAIFGWNEGRPNDGFAPLAFDPQRLAFGPQHEQVRSELPAAPEQGPEHLPAGRTLREKLTRPPAASTWESSAAWMYLNYFGISDGWRQQEQQKYSATAFAASLIGMPALSPGALFVAPPILTSAKFLEQLEEDEPRQLTAEQLGPYFVHLTEHSPALPLLAVRAARRAVAANPQDANAWLQLGQAYRQLYLATCERSVEGIVPPLRQLRHVQIVTALEQALRLEPDLEAAHRELAIHFNERKWYDVILDHRRHQLRILLQRRQPRQTAEEEALGLGRLETEIRDLEKIVQEQRNKYASAVSAISGDRVAQAKQAMSLGLARMAAEEILMPTSPATLGLPGMKMELELLLTLGRTEEVRGVLNDPTFSDPKNKKALPYQDLPPPPAGDGTPLYIAGYRWPSYEWLRVLQTAAVGDYALAKNNLRLLQGERKFERERNQFLLKGVDVQVNRSVGYLWSGSKTFLPAYAAIELSQLVQGRFTLQAIDEALRAQQADLKVIEGLLALEVGAPDEAQAAFVAAQKLCEEPSGLSIPFAGGRIAGAYLEKLNGNKPK